MKKIILFISLIMFISCKKEINIDLKIQERIKSKYNTSEYYQRKYTPVAFSKVDTISSDKTITKGIVSHTYKSTESYNGTILKDYTDKFNVEIYDRGLIIVKKILNEKDIYNKNLETLKKEASRLRGGGQIKEVKLNKNKTTIIYCSNYKEYKKLQPQSNLSKKDIDNYWETSNTLKKMLVGGPVRLMKKLDFLNEVEITIKRNRKTYSVIVRKKELEKFIGKSFDIIKIGWEHNFINPYVYDKKGRDKFFKEFGKIK